VKFIVGLTIGGPGYNPDDILAVARRADELGFDVVSAGERLIMPRVIDSKYPYGPTGAIPGVGTLQNTLEVLSVMSFVAGQTARVRLMPSVIVLPYRNPVLAAKILATIDVLSKGRLIVGCGVGWSLEEAQALMVPTPFERRGAVSDEYIRAFKELWTSEEPEFHGEYLEVSGVEFAPKPVQKPHPPFWIGGESPAAIRRAATLGDGWLPVNGNPAYPLDTTERFTEAVSRLRRRLEAEGRDPHDFAIRFGSIPWSGDKTETSSGGDRVRFTGHDEQIADDIRSQEGLGVTHMGIDVRGDTVSERLEAMESFATRLMPLVHG
jgi:probable F420-dependent oxidoreductase